VDVLRFLQVIAIWGCLWPPAFVLAETGIDAGVEEAFVQDVVPFLQVHCAGCHGGESAEGGIALDEVMDASALRGGGELWEKVVRVVSERQMPPQDEPQPAEDEITKAVAAIHSAMNAIDCGSGTQPGRVTIRRLNRAEYNNTVRDLLGIDFRPADDFPSDDVGHGFDNIGDVLAIPPLLMEKYLDAAEQVAQRTFENPESRRRVVRHEVAEGDDVVAVAMRNLREFASDAYRRPVTDEELGRLFGIMRLAYEQGSPPDEIYQTVMLAVLTNPHFLFRVERDPSPEDEDGIRELGDYELASRLSYFLWSSMPDAQLFAVASEGRLREPEVLASEVRRMLADPKARALVDNFAGQWLQLRNLSRLAPDPDRYPGFDDALRQAMQRETEMLFETIVREDRSVKEFLTADYTYVNQRLAEHYGIDGISGDQFVRVSQPVGRRGVLTQASILTLTSNPTRTSPVKRGKWVLDNLLGEPPPPPPPGVEELKEGADQLGTLRDRMEQHRSNPSCAVCHTKMDAIGFGMENFDGIGAWREMDGRDRIDPTGTLPGNVGFSGPEELVDLLCKNNAEAFLRCLAKRMLTYALGRGLESYDRCAVNGILDRMAAEDHRFSAMVIAIVNSDPFRYRAAR
jgi:hypothetical protein